MTIRKKKGVSAPRFRDKEFNAALGGRIRARREKLGIAMSALADAIGVSVGQMSRYESGLTSIEPSVLSNIAKNLRCKAGTLLEGKP